MTIKIGSTRIDDLIKALDGRTLDGITFRYTGQKMGINAKFEHDGSDFETAKKAVKAFTKSTEEFAALFISIQP
ncbi:MAG: hypothetical protein IJI44_04185 [Erysipelotrichaceae bacterium]|nr:hypothetical protein [Erysipelotrichaceae bacterium]